MPKARQLPRQIFGGVFFYRLVILPMLKGATLAQAPAMSDTYRLLPSRLRWSRPPPVTMEEQEENRFVTEALERHKREGMILAIRARWASLAVVGVLLPFLNPNIEVLYYHALLFSLALVGYFQFRIARVGLVTPLRDGMNLVCKEFIMAQDEADPGVLILSEFAGAAEQLKSALLVNPHDTGKLAEVIHHALTMPLEERSDRWQSLRDIVMKQDISWWRQKFLKDLDALQVGST